MSFVFAEQTAGIIKTWIKFSRRAAAGVLLRERTELVIKNK
jgi:hypothetical protein